MTSRPRPSREPRSISPGPAAEANRAITSAELISGKWMEIGYTNVTSNTFSVTGLQPNTSYQFKVGDFEMFSPRICSTAAR